MKSKFSSTALRLLLVLVVSGGVALWWLGNENAALRAELAQRRAELTRREPPAPATVEPVSTAAPAAAEPAVASAQTARSTGPAPAAGAETMRGLADLKRQWREPAERARRFEEAVRRIERTHGRLFQSLSALTPEQREALKHALAENELAAAEAALPDDASPEQTDGRARQQALERATAEGEARLQAMLEPADLERLQMFQKSQACRPLLEPVAESMRSAGVTIDEALQERMLAAYASAYRTATEQAAQASATLAGLSREEQNRRQKEALHLELMRRMAGVLNEAQLSAFMQAQLETE